MKVYNDEEKGQHELFVIIDIWRVHKQISSHSRDMVMKRKNEDEEELDVNKAAKLEPPPEEVMDTQTPETIRHRVRHYQVFSSMWILLIAFLLLGWTPTNAGSRWQ